jgi:hypothetical protein
MVVDRTGRGKEAGIALGVVGFSMETLIPITEVTITIPTTIAIIGIEATTIGGQQVISRRISISKLLVILGSLVILEISLVGVMLVGPIHQLQLFLSLSILLLLLLLLLRILVEAIDRLEMVVSRNCSVRDAPVWSTILKAAR